MDACETCKYKVVSLAGRRRMVLCFRHSAGFPLYCCDNCYTYWVAASDIIMCARPQHRAINAEGGREI